MDTTAPAPAAPKPNHPKFVRWAIVLGIIIVLNVFFLVIRSLVFPTPDISDYCPNANGPMPATAVSCDAAGGTWTDYSADPTVQAAPAAPTGYCDLYATCQPLYDAAQQKYDLYAFTLLLALGIVALIVGVLPIGSSIVSSGLSFGGVLALIIGSVMYWGEASNWLRLGISVVALAALLYVAYQRFKD